MPRVDVGGIEISYRDSGGEGTPVLLVHGFPFDAALWDPQFAALGQTFRLIAPDLRGFGNSTEGEYSMEAFARDLAGLLDRLEIERVVLGGLSMGGYVVFEFWRRYPERVMALVLADTRADADAPEVLDKRTAQQEQVRSSGPDDLVTPMTQALLSDDTRTDHPEVVRALEDVMQQAPSAWIGGLQAMKERADSTGDLSSISVPTLILVGENDALIPVELSRAMHERIPSSRLVVLERAGHVANLEAPDAFNQALAAFLNEL